MTDEVLEGTPQRTALKGLLARGIEGVRKGILGIAAIGFAMRDEGSGFILAAGGFAVAIFVVTLVFSYLAWTRLTYTIGDSDIRVESGILARAARAVPFERIQDVSLEQGFIPRLFGLVEVKFETGAGGKDDLKLAYLTEDDGEALRDLLRARRESAPVAANANANAETGEPEAAAEEAALLFTMGPRRVLTFGLFEFSLAAVAALAGAVQQFDFLLAFDFWDLDAWQKTLAGPGDWLAGLGFAARIIGIGLVVGTLLLVGLATGFVRTALREWGFRLERTARGLRRRRGLLTRTDVVMPVHRVQALRLGTGFLRRLFGWHSLKIVSLASDSGAANHEAAPFATMAEIAPIVATTGFALPDDDLEWHGVSRKYRIDRVLLSAAALVPVAIALPFVGEARLIPLPLAGLALIALHEYLRLRWDRHALGSQQLFTRHGWLAPSLAIGSRVKLQSVEIAQGPIALRRGYASLLLGLAGGRLRVRGMALAEARNWREAILTTIASQDFSQLSEPAKANTITPAAHSSPDYA
ncbi:PH domain-containing protein [Qipengyuania marisflavi]|uniref:YdbS-like PH domain-containing protein n=1 Tax=Qipengyuania marisflavi TaxID=2486356 RepID=A0A5S3P5D2_9SPHN|nr:PH domain-containing protein [Qipengyuania marisflavi]TMM48126.1 hypothetical protein FEV51_07430 [Qipengyuania marisflavi]